MIFPTAFDQPVYSEENITSPTGIFTHFYNVDTKPAGIGDVFRNF